MGRLNTNPVQQSKEAISPEQQIHHFSHPHVLHLTNQPPNRNTSCFACKSTLSGSTYSCFPCNYFLHISCSQQPRKITHPFDRHGHTLHLLPVPPYPEGSFKCDACGKQGTGFCYSCAQCGIDLHTTCAAMPLLVTHGSHFHHLDLAFSPPYHNKSFSCDLCKMTGYNHWLYRCHSCEFDVHLDCAMGKISQAAPIQSQPGAIVNNNQQNYLNPGVQYQQPIPLNYGVQYQQPGSPNPGVQYQKPGPPSNYGSVRINSGQGYQRGAMVNSGVQGFVNGASQAVGQTLMMGLLGGVGLGIGAGDAGVNGGGGGTYCDGGYTEMNDSGTIQDSCDSMDAMGCLG